MIKTLRKSAKTEDDAIRLGLEELGLDRDDVSVTLIERAKSGFLGIGGTPAVVELAYEVPDEVPEPPPAPKAEPKSEPRPVAEPVRNDRKASPRPERVTAEPSVEPRVVAVPKTEPRAAREPEPRAAQKPAPRAVSQSPSQPPKESELAAAARAKEFLDGLFERYGANTEIIVGEVRDGELDITLNCDDAGALIGRRGETLEAVQSLTNYVVNRGNHRVLRVNVDAEGYKQRREETLIALAQRTGEKVLKYRRSITLDSMNAYERHVIHTALQEVAGVSTHSVGSEPNRRVVVSAGSGGAQRQERGNYRNDRRPERRDNDRRDRPAREPRPATVEVAVPVQPAQPAPSEPVKSDAGETKNYREWK
jgi:spoIIIJ-associated protein